MRKHYRLLLSDDAYKVLKEKASFVEEPTHKVLESMIMEFSPSSGEERYASKLLKDQMRQAFLDKNPSAPPEKIWNSGFNSGWNAFQLRKTTSMFKKYREELKRRLK